MNATQHCELDLDLAIERQSWEIERELRRRRPTPGNDRRVLARIFAAAGVEFGRDADNVGQVVTTGRRAT